MPFQAGSLYVCVSGSYCTLGMEASEMRHLLSLAILGILTITNPSGNAEADRLLNQELKVLRSMLVRAGGDCMNQIPTLERCGHGWNLSAGQACPMCALLLPKDGANGAKNVYSLTAVKALLLACRLIGATPEQKQMLFDMAERRNYYAAIKAARELQQ